MKIKTPLDKDIKDMTLEELRNAKNKLISELELIDEIESLNKSLKIEVKILEQMREKLKSPSLTSDELGEMENNTVGQSMVIARLINELNQKKQEFDKK